MVQQVPGTAVNVDSILATDAATNAFFEGPISLGILLLNLLVGVALAGVLQWHYRRYATTLSNKEQFARVFQFIVLTTLLIITIVKSSLALSLGLVGALSIVRFRTPIKEPEELAYLFICIAMGLGLGANQTVPTVLAVGFIMLVGAIAARRRGGTDHKSLYLSVSWADANGSPGSRLDTLNSRLAEHGVRGDLRWIDLREGRLEANYFVEFSSSPELPGLLESLSSGDQPVEVTFIDQSRLPSI